MNKNQTTQSAAGKVVKVKKSHSAFGNPQYALAIELESGSIMEARTPANASFVLGFSPAVGDRLAIQFRLCRDAYQITGWVRG